MQMPTQTSPPGMNENIINSTQAVTQQDAGIFYRGDMVLTGHRQPQRHHSFQLARDIPLPLFDRTSEM